MSQPRSILVVDDEQQVADAYALRLRLNDDYEVQTAYGGEEALDVIDEDVDVLLLDRRMAGVSGDEVLASVKERGLDIRVIMVTAVDPDFDILEMPFDDYLCKPIDKHDLLSAIEQQLNFRTYDETLTEYMATVGKVNLLEGEKLPEELEENEAYQRLSRKAEDLRERLDDTFADFEDMELAFREIGRQADV